MPSFRRGRSGLGALLCLLSCTSVEPTTPDVVERLAFGSCAMQQLDQPIWDSICDTQPDLFVFLGDAIYGDWDGQKVVPATPDSLREDWARLGAKPGFQRLRGQVPLLATWDNHDYGTHDGGAEFSLRESSKSAFLDFFGEPEDSPRRIREGIYDATTIGPPGRRLQLILLDTRSFKGPHVKDPRTAEEKAAQGVVGKYLPQPDPSISLLGEAQW